MTKSITFKQIAEYEADLAHTPASKALAKIVQNVGPNAASHGQLEDKTIKPTFSIELDTDAVTNQLHSGRCWLFAQLNTMRHFAAKQANLPDLKFSQSYLAFFDRLEKSNHFLNQMIETADKPLTDREVSNLLAAPNGDGGQYDNAAALVEKYGLVPKSAMPETFTSSNTADFNKLLNKKLRQIAHAIRHAEASEREALKQAALSDIYRMLSYAYGSVPTTFDFEYRDKDKQYHRDADLTPQSFYQKYIGWALDDYVTITSTTEKPYWQSYALPAQDYVENGRPIRFVNVPQQTMEQLAVAQLKAGEAVWFGNDVLADMDRDSGTLRGGLYALSDLFHMDLHMSQADRFATGEAVVSHAMTLTGVDLVDDQPRSWKVENSWGKDRGHDGYFVADEAWFKAYSYECVIRRDLLPENVLAAEATKPVVLPAWDSLR